MFMSSARSAGVGGGGGGAILHEDGSILHEDGSIPAWLDHPFPYWLGLQSVHVYSFKYKWANPNNIGMKKEDSPIRYVSKVLFH